MRIAIALGLVLALQGCADAESELEPRTPADTPPAYAPPSCAADVEDRFEATFDAAEQHAPPPRPVRSVSLGFIGDGPLGVEPSPPHEEPYWTRPFPCDWTGTCRLTPRCPCGGFAGR